MHNGSKKIVVLAGVIFVLLSVPLFSGLSSDADTTDDMLLWDMGNGKTEWINVKTTSGTNSIDDVLKETSAGNFNYDSSGITITINGKTDTTIGNDPPGTGSFTVSGYTGIKVTSAWKAYKWTSSKEWVPVTDLSESYSGGHLALGFYPDGIVPNETPEYRTSWTMVRGDAEQTGAQETDRTSTEPATVKWTESRGKSSGVLAAMTYVQNYVFVKFSTGSGLDPVVQCYDIQSGDLKWEFKYPGMMNYETGTPIIIGDHIYVPAAEGYIFKMPWRTGPGVYDNVTGTYADATTFNGDPFIRNDLEVRKDAIPLVTGATLTGFEYNTGPGSLVYDSGVIYCMSSNGMAYCFDMDLNLIWSYQMGGHAYYISPTVYDDYVFTGALNGSLYALDKRTGECIDSKSVFVRTLYGSDYGSVSAVSVFKNGAADYTLMFSISDGRGMSSTIGGLGIYEFEMKGTKMELSRTAVITDVFGLTSNYLLPVDTPEFRGIYFAPTRGLFKVDLAGNYTLLNNSMYPVKAPLTLLNGQSIILSSYEPGKPIYEVGFNGEFKSIWTPSSTVRNYGMSPALFIGDQIFIGNDAGLIVGTGAFPVYIPPTTGDEGMPAMYKMVIAFVVLIIILAMIYAILRFGKGVEKPFSYLFGRAKNYVGSETLMHNTRSKHRLLVVMLAGISLTVGIFIACLCIGPTMTMSIPEMFSALFSSISKGGQNLTYEELMVYESRLPRTLAAIGVGIGLAIAGCMYQAIIRNPLVDPYIMGVSAGAGTAAVAVIAFDFTFFGLFSSHSIYLTAFAAIIGGVAAFFATMLIAEKAGGNSLNYVLAGVVVGLAFSAVQTLMLSFAGHQVSNALAWLFGSFANVSWHEVGLILIPALALSLVPLIWAKEFNLVLLGEDQAQQMGLNVRKFNRIMLILASILTSICVAFVGIIGFVGLVIPHVCRMMLGGDHRLVLPASIAFGGALMMFADLAARMLYIGQELPVGAITTIIGVPVFAYLLIKRGKLYEG